MDGDSETYGVTGPVSTKGSTPEAIELSKKLSEYLEASGFFESEESGQMRERVLGKLDFLLKKFVKEIAPDDKNYGGKIFTFGSYRLGVHDCGADIDTLCVVPRHVSITDFFTVFYERLKEDPNISDISKIEDAYVPLIEMRFHGIPIDLTFARLNLPIIKDNINILNDSLLRNMDEKCVVSLNGSRVTDVMLRLVPNKATFRGALRSIKFWARRRFVSGASYGYFGGVAFSICVARICQMYPNFCSYDIVCKFFETFASWKWPNPVILREVPDLNYNLKVWDPKINPSDRYHKMPVITPAYPPRCATHNVTQSTALFFTSELLRAHEILSSPLSSLEDTSDRLFAFSDFFKKFRIFIEVVASAEESVFLGWKGFVESRIRVLSMKLEVVENIAAAIPFAKAFITKCGNSEEALDNVVAVEEEENNKKRVKLSLQTEEKVGDSDNNKFSASKSVGYHIPVKVPLRETKIHTARFYIAIDLLPTKKTEKKLYIDEPINEYFDLLNSWDKKTETMHVDIHARKKKDVQRFIREYYRSEDNE